MGHAAIFRVKICWRNEARALPVTLETLWFRAGRRAARHPYRYACRSAHALTYFALGDEPVVAPATRFISLVAFEKSSRAIAMRAHSSR
jgi:hypothetical protein